CMRVPICDVCGRSRGLRGVPEGVTTGQTVSRGNPLRLQLGADRVGRDTEMPRRRCNAPGPATGLVRDQARRRPQATRRGADEREAIMAEQTTKWSIEETAHNLAKLSAEGK